MAQETRTIQGQPSWKVACNSVEAWLTEAGGHLGPIYFRKGDREIAPFHIAPWAEEPTDPSLPQMLKSLRGDFFCMPFGGNETTFIDEKHPPHGETANAIWRLEDLVQDGPSTTLAASLETRVRPGRVDKYVRLDNDQWIVYQRHVISGLEGPMSFGHHVMLALPDQEGAGRISTGRFVTGMTAPLPLERPEEKGYSLLQPDAGFRDLQAVPSITGSLLDLSRYPARRGFEDLVTLVNDPGYLFGWTAVSVPDAGYVWFGIKRTAVLGQTVLWFSNMGRYYRPWSGRHTNVLGVEEVTSYFHYGLKESVTPNPISEAGFPTSVELQSDEAFEVRYLMGVAGIPPDFGAIDEITLDESGVHLLGVHSSHVLVEADSSFLEH